ncbi:MAG: VOC family protein [Alphaproteobacteria bacterium]|jgi:catechol 2,3-dioxygenase-like lactoylglutathione lyase family enzyme
MTTDNTNTGASVNISAPLTKGVHHVGLTVLDVEQTAQFFTDVLNMNEVARRPEYPAIFVSDGAVMITLWQAENPATATAFDGRANIGLHHLALAMGDSEQLDALHGRLDAMGDVDIEFAPEPLGAIPFRHMMCRIPGGVRIEFIAPQK